MKTMGFVLVLILASLTVSQVAPAGEESTALHAKGEELVRELWADIRANNVDAVERKLSTGFQSVHQDGSRNRDQEIALIKALKLGEYTLTDFSITQDGPVIVAIYFVSVEETIEGKRLSSEPAPRLSVFLETDDGWKWTAHANLKPLK